MNKCIGVLLKAGVWAIFPFISNNGYPAHEISFFLDDGQLFKAEFWKLGPNKRLLYKEV